MTAKLVLLVVAALVFVSYVDCDSNIDRRSKVPENTKQQKEEVVDEKPDAVEVNSNDEEQAEGALNRHKRNYGGSHGHNEKVVVLVKEGHKGHEGYGEHGHEHGGFGEHGGYDEHEEHGHGGYGGGGHGGGHGGGYGGGHGGGYGGGHGYGRR